MLGRHTHRTAVAALAAAGVVSLGVMTVTAPAASAAAAPVTVLNTPNGPNGSPVIYDQARNADEVYAVSTSGVVEQDAYASGSWRWQSLGRSIRGSFEGTPSALYDPYTGAVDVFAIAADHTLMEDAYANGHWTGWRDLGGSLAGSPSAIIDKATHAVDVFATATSGALSETSWSSAHGWSHWSDLGLLVTGTPAPNNDEASGNLEVYAISRDHTLEEDAYVNGRWAGWRTLSSLAFSGSPAVSYYPQQGQPEVVLAITTGGALEAATWKRGGTGWSTTALSPAGTLTGSPSATQALLSTESDLDVYATDREAGVLFEYAYTDGHWVNSGTVGDVSPAIDPVAFYNPLADDGTTVYALSGATSGMTLSQITWSATTREWSGWTSLGTGLSAL
ncbi:MAG TPA: hypothetical protein VI365_28530 [Trebonia sp.]